MKRPLVFLACAAALLAGQPSSVHAWEPATTHAGLTEQAAASSNLHKRLKALLGADLGLFTRLTIPPADAPALFKLLRSLNPVHGYVPDGRGRQRALSWIVVGSVLADYPTPHAGHHFFDPLTGKGLTNATVSGRRGFIRKSLLPKVSGQRVIESGMSAPAWVVSPRNPLGLSGFLTQYAKAVRSRTPGERSRHLAAALIAAGAILHVLQDMGSPSHVRNDLAAHLDQVGPSRSDAGSRMERVAAVAYGRLGIPAAARSINAKTLRGFFTAKDLSGLADRTTHAWFSAYTLPQSMSFKRLSKDAMASKLARSVKRPHPAPLPRLKLVAASGLKGRRLTRGGTCLAQYRVRRGVLSWFTGDECLLEQLQVILPQVAGYGAGLIDFLFRGQLAIARGGGALAVAGRGLAVGRGTVEVFWDDRRGVRTRMGSYQVAGGRVDAVLSTMKLPPAGARRISALFVGVDANGEPLVAAGTTKWPTGAGAKR